MALDLFAHPFSSYSQKALIALRMNKVPFRYRALMPEDEATIAEWRALWPIGRFPVLKDGDRTIVEATAIIEYLDVHHPGPHPMIPSDPAEAVEARMLDRVFDNYLMTPMQKIVLDAIRSADRRDATGVAEARAMLDRVYAWLDGRLAALGGAGEVWATGDGFGLADCAAAPSLFYADWAHPIPADRRHLAAYRERLLAEPTVAALVDEGRPYRKNFPLGAPDRD